MKIFWVLEYYDYYPSSDNFLESFSTMEEAEAFVEKMRDQKDTLNYRIINIANRL